MCTAFALPTLALLGAISLVGCGQKENAANICHKIEAAGIGKNCSQSSVKPGTAGARARTRFDFELTHVPGKGGAVLDFGNGADYLATVNTYAALAAFAGPHRYGNPSTRIFVQMSSDVPAEDGNAVRGIVGGEVAPASSSTFGGDAAIPASSTSPPLSASAAKAAIMRAFPFPTKATDLYEQYQKNEVAADEQFKGRRLFVWGTIASIEKDALGRMLVNYKVGRSSLNRVLAHVRETEKSKVVRLERNQVVYLLCDGAGAVLETPTLDDCLVSSDADVGCSLDAEIAAVRKAEIREKTEKGVDATTEKKQLAEAEANLAKCHSDAGQP